MKKFRVMVLIPSAIVISAESPVEALEKAEAMSDKERLDAFDGAYCVRLTNLVEEVA